MVVDGGDERSAQPVGHRRRQRRQAVALGVERAQRRGNESVRALGFGTFASAELIFACVPEKSRQRGKRAGTADAAYFFSQAAKASAKARSPGGPFSIARMARPPLV